MSELLPGAQPPIEHTYRNAYGTRFECSSTCMLLLGVHVVLVVGGLLLLSVIPVRFATNEKLEAPFVLWFGSPKKKSKKKPVEKKKGNAEQSGSLCSRMSTWLVQTTSSFFVATPGRDVDMRYRFHADMTQQLAASARAAKTYESIAVATDDLEVMHHPSPQSYTRIAVSTDDLEVKKPLRSETDEMVAVAVDELEVKPPPPPQTEEGGARATGELKVGSPSSRHLTRPSSRSSIFMAPPSPPSMLKIRQGSTRFASDAGSLRADSIGRRTSPTSSGAVETKEDFVRAASRRQSIAVRAERRVTLAQEDVSYENLGDDEIRMYEYLEFVRELLDGLAIKKVCQKSGRVVSRTLYITPDMTTVFWNPAGTFKRLRNKSSIETYDIEQVLKGIHGSANATARSTLERDTLCVSIQCSDGKWLVLEAKTEAARQRLFIGFYRLAQEKLEQEATAPVESAIPEDRDAEDAEALMEEQEHQVQLSALAREQQQQQQALPTEVTVEREEKLRPLEEEEVVVGAEHLDYEEKAPPPLLDESFLLRHEILSTAASSREESNDGDRQQDEDGQIDEREQGEHGRNEEEGLQGPQSGINRAVEEERMKEHQLQEGEENKAIEEENMAEEFPFQEQDEEAREGGAPGEANSNPDDDPEMSRE
ncbi:hypothetical protein PRNP1_014731 [Phytophthora ramorum]